MSTPARTESDTSIALLGAASAMLAGGDLESTIRAALSQALQVTGGRYAACGVIDPATGGFGKYITEGFDDATVRAIGEPPRGRGVLGLLISSPEPVRLDRIGSHPQSYGFPVNHPPMTSFLGVGLWLNGRPWGSLCVTDKTTADRFSADDERFLVGLADLAVRIAEPHQRAEDAQARVAQLAQDQAAYAASNDIARSLAGQPDLGHMMELIVKRGRALTGARDALLALVGVDGLVVEAVAGTLDSDLLGHMLPLDDRDRQALDAGSPRLAVRAGVFDELANWLDASSLMAVPLMIRNQPVGLLVCSGRLDGGDTFSRHDMVLAEAFGTSAAVAIATARTAQEQALQRAITASERERAHWARELHDQTLQELAAIKLLLGMAQRAPGEQVRTELLANAASQIDAASVELRRLVAELRPAALDAHGLEPAIQGLVARIASINGQDIVFEWTVGDGQSGTDDRLDPEVEGVVYRVVQEALNNVARHSGAAAARVTIDVGAGVLRAVVSDDGRGFDPGRQGGGFGLIGMRERAELIGGDLRVESRPNEGTTVSLVAPIDSEVRHG